MKYAFDQLRLYISERLAFWAFKIAPNDHPSKIAFAKGYAVMASEFLGKGVEWSFDVKTHAVFYDHKTDCVRVVGVEGGPEDVE